MQVSSLHFFGGKAWVEVVADAIIQISSRHVDETFLFDGFARFSRRIDPRRVARLSVTSRPYRRDKANTAFFAGFQKANYETDAGRAPYIGTGALAHHNRQIIASHPQLLGHMPRGWLPHNAAPAASY